MYQIKLEQFEGPFEMLFELVEKRKLSINQISLAKVADQYLAHIKNIEQFPMEDVASFISIAATLMLIKSRSLLPSLQLNSEEETEIINLEEQLKIYEKYRHFAKQLEKIFGREVIFAREPFAQAIEIFVEPKGLTLLKIAAAIRETLDNLPKKEILPQTLVVKTISLEEKIKELTSRLQEKVNLCFSDMAQTGCDKVELIVNFLAMLELIKRGFAIAAQNKNFGEIQINKI